MADSNNRPVMVLLSMLGQRWALRILWELRGQRLTFRELQKHCDDVSPTSLNRRLKELREAQILDHNNSGFGYTALGLALGDQLMGLNEWAETWHESLR